LLLFIVTFLLIVVTLLLRCCTLRYALVTLLLGALLFIAFVYGLHFVVVCTFRRLYDYHTFNVTPHTFVVTFTLLYVVVVTIRYVVVVVVCVALRCYLLTFVYVCCCAVDFVDLRCCSLRCSRCYVVVYDLLILRLIYVGCLIYPLRFLRVVVWLPRCYDYVCFGLHLFTLLPFTVCDLPFVTCTCVLLLLRLRFTFYDCTWIVVVFCCWLLCVVHVAVVFALLLLLLLLLICCCCCCCSLCCTLPLRYV